MKHWLLKSEPDTYSFAQLVADKKTLWSGIRNFTARNHLRAMTPGDLALFFHTGKERAAVGIAKITTAPAPDPTATEGDWVAVQLAPVKALPAPVTLSVMKATAALADMAMLRQARLSVSPLTKAEYDTLLRLAGV